MECIRTFYVNTASKSIDVMKKKNGYSFYLNNNGEITYYKNLCELLKDFSFTSKDLLFDLVNNYI